MNEKFRMNHVPSYQTGLAAATRALQQDLEPAKGDVDLAPIDLTLPLDWRISAPTPYTPTIATLRRRLAAFLIDGLVCSQGGAVLLFGFTLLAERAGVPVSENVAGWMLLLGPLAYFTSCESLFGATLAKRILGIRVVDRAGDPIGWFAVVVRNLLRITDFSPLSILLASLSPERRKLGDRVAGTIVIRAGR